VRLSTLPEHELVSALQHAAETVNSVEARAGITGIEAGLVGFTQRLLSEREYGLLRVVEIVTEVARAVEFSPVVN
jgi:hypothetical protein